MFAFKEHLVQISARLPGTVTDVSQFLQMKARIAFLPNSCCLKFSINFPFHSMSYELLPLKQLNKRTTQITHGLI
jgi:hypothetical protein